MKIASLVVRAKPEHFPSLHSALSEIPGVELHGECSSTGQMIVTVEDGENWAMTDSILAVNLAPHVLNVTLAYEYTDESLASQEL